MRIGPRTQEQLSRLALNWKQGEHVFISGGTGSGKTELARQLDEIRLRRGGHVVAFVCKTQPDKTFTESYKGWTRWTTWKARPNVSEDRILLWPKVEGMTREEAVPVFKKEFARALDGITKTGKWTVHIDEGLFVTSPHFLNLGPQISYMYQMMRSANGTMITLAQRPSHLPLSIYANISHAFVGRASETSDLKRLADLDSVTSSRELQRMINGNGKHDYIWIPVGTDWPPERVNLAR